MNRIGRALRGAALTLGSFARQTLKTISLAPVYLAHLLWLLSQEFLELAQKGYGGNSAAYAVVSFLCIAVAEPPLAAYTRQEDGDPDEPLPWAHPLRQLLRSPNPFLTEYEHLELLTLHLVIAGRYTAWKERDNLGRVIGLWPLRPDRVGPIYGDAAAGEPLLIGWSYLVPGTTHYAAIPAGDIIMLNLPDPAGESGGIVEGLGPLQVLAAEISADNEATKFVGSLLSNYATPGVVLQVQGKITDKATATLIKEAYQRDFGGARRGQPAVIDQGSTVQPVSFSLQQLEFPNLRNISESRIAAALHVPAVLVGLHVGLDAAIKATTDELRSTFAETTLASYWRRYADGFTEQLAVEFDPDIVCAFDLTKVKALAAQNATRLAEIQAGFADGVVTVEEYRDALGLDRIDNGNVFMYGIAPGRGTGTPVPAGEHSQEPGDVPDNSTDKPNALPAQTEAPNDNTDSDKPKDPGQRSAEAPESGDIAIGAGELRRAFAALNESVFAGHGHS